MDWYHAHVYFNLQQTQLANAMRQNLLQALPDLAYLGPLIMQPIGPHPMPMFEIHIAASQLALAMTTLDTLRQGLSVLIHPVQADEVAAHTVNARWLGRTLILDIAFLERFQQAGGH